MERPTHGRLLAVLLAGVALGAPALRAEGRFFAAATPHYDVASDVDPQFTKELGQHMEAIYQAYVDRFRGFTLKTGARFTVKVFALRADYYDAIPGEMAGSTGAFVSALRLLAAYREGRTDEEVFRTLYHEGFHQFLYTCVTERAPLWVNEGLAEYFSEAAWNSRRFSTGNVPIARVHCVQTALRAGRHIPLEQLFGMDSSSWMRNLREQQDRSELQYSEAWSVVHFLVHAASGQYRPRLLAYLRAMSEGRPHEEAFQKSFGSNVAAFEKAWASYVMQLQPSCEAFCRRNLDMLGHLALMTHGDPRQFRSLKDLRARLLDERARWSIGSSDGQSVSSEDRRAAMGLFVCPCIRPQAPITYVLVQSPETGLPMLVCAAHPGVVVVSRFVPDSAGRYEVKTEQYIRAVLPAEIAAALQAAGSR